MAGFLRPCPAYSRLALRMLNGRRFVGRLRRRYEMALAFARGMAELRPIFGDLPPGVAPRAMAAVSSDVPASIARLKSAGVYATCWPRLPRAVRDQPGRYPSFYRRVVVIPLAGPELLMGRDPADALSRPATTGRAGGRAGRRPGEPRGGGNVKKTAGPAKRPPRKPPARKGRNGT